MNLTLNEAKTGVPESPQPGRSTAILRNPVSARLMTPITEKHLVLAGYFQGWNGEALKIQSWTFS